MSGEGDAGNASFRIVGGKLRTAALFRRATRSLYSIRVRSTDAGGLSTEKAFTIRGTSAVRVASPNGRQSWKRGTLHRIAWTSSLGSGTVNVRLYRGSALSRIISGRAARNGSLYRRIPSFLPKGKNFKFRAHPKALTCPPKRVTPIAIFDPLEFLAAVTSHIPNRGEHLVRYFGWYSSVQRGRRRRQGWGKQTLGPLPLSHARAPAKAARANWARLIKKVITADPMVCPDCGGGLPRNRPHRGSPGYRGLCSG